MTDSGTLLPGFQIGCVLAENLVKPYVSRLIVIYCKTVSKAILSHRPVFTLAICAYFSLSQLMLLCWSGRLKWLKTDCKTAISSSGI